MNLEQAQRFYETLAMLIGQREGVEITVKVTPRKEGKHGGQQNRETYSDIPKRETMQVS